MESKKNNQIKDIIRILRNKQRLTQVVLARKCDLSYITLTKIEANTITKPSTQIVVKIASGLRTNF